MTRTLMQTPMTTVPTITIRLAHVQDYPKCVELACALRDETHWANWPIQPIAEQIQRWLQSMDCVLIAECDEALVGLCGGSLAQHPLYASAPFIWEQVWYVIPEKRRELIGARLLRQFKTWGAAHGAKALLFGRPRQKPPGEELIWYRFGGRHA